MEISKDSFICITSSMIKNPKLYGANLLIYAIINGFSHADNTWYTGTRKFLADMSKTTVKTVERSLEYLISEGLIEKQEKYFNNVKFCYYRCTENIPKTDFSGSDKMSLGEGDKMSHSENNKIAYIEKENTIKERSSGLEQHEEKNIPFEKNPEPVEKDTCFSFEEFWNLYEKKVERVKCEAIYAKLPESVRMLIKERLPEYVNSTPQKEYRKNPQTWLHGECWNDEVIRRDENGRIPPKKINRYLKGF